MYGVKKIETMVSINHSISSPPFYLPSSRWAEAMHVATAGIQGKANVQAWGIPGTHIGACLAFVGIQGSPQAQSQTRSTC